MNRFPKITRHPFDRAPQTNPAHWGEGGRVHAHVPLPRHLPGELVRVVARRGSPWDWLPGTGVVVAAGSTPRGMPWYQVLVGDAVHELWAEELEGL